MFGFRDRIEVARGLRRSIRQVVTCAKNDNNECTLQTTFTCLSLLVVANYVCIGQLGTLSLAKHDRVSIRWPIEEVERASKCLFVSMVSIACPQRTRLQYFCGSRVGALWGDEVINGAVQNGLQVGCRLC